MTDRPTPVQSFAMNLLFGALGENPINRTPEQYEQIKSRIPKALKTVHYLINERLSRLARTEEFASHKICHFKDGHKIIRFEPYPTSISAETVRKALIVYGWRDAPRRRRH